MTHSATGLLISVRLTLAAALLSCAGAAAAQDDQKVVTNRDPGVMDVAQTPLQDLNLTKDEIPEALTDAVTAPYASERLAKCEDIRREVLRLDEVLGDDLDIVTDERRDITIGKLAKSAVGSFIPFRGVIRELTGAADRKRDFEEAILAGAVRRGYLKGLGDARGCAYPARPASTRISMNDAAVQEIAPAAPKPATVTQGGITFVSNPVVQGN